MIFWWWDDAMAVANGYARETGERWCVRRFAGMWRATKVGAA